MDLSRMNDLRGLAASEFDVALAGLVETEMVKRLSKLPVEKPKATKKAEPVKEPAKKVEKSS